MTPEERATWERRRFEAKLHLAKIAPKRKKLKEMLKKYDKIFCRHQLRFAEADERLAMEDRFQRVPSPGERRPRRLDDYSAEELLAKMNKSQVNRLREALAEVGDEELD